MNRKRTVSRPSRGFFHQVYEEGRPPWDIGRPQPAFVGLEEAGKIQGAVLDVGCGSGDNALYLAERGYEVRGLDMVPEAIRQAQRKAEQRGLAVTFTVADALALETLGRQFDTIIDSGLFHTFSDSQRPLYLKSLATVLPPGGRYFLLCFSDREPENDGPRRIRQEEIRTLFRDGWRVESIQATRFTSRSREQGAYAWLAVIIRE